ncbi:transposable element Tcb1 transposase [Trichonephila clavipes]|nr:transposable element Tcb1 transposase [Trichonephila clavipes]
MWVRHQLIALSGWQGCILTRTVESNQSGIFDSNGIVADSFRRDKFNTKNKVGKSQKWDTTSVDDKRMKLLFLQYRRISTTAVRSDFNNAGVFVSLKTTRRRLADVRIGRIPRKKALYQFTAALKKLQCGQRNTLIEQMISCHKLYGDETKISLFNSDGRKYVRHRIGQMLHPDCIQATMKYPHSFIWSCISADAISCLHIIDGTLEVRKYIDILEPKLLPSIRDLFINNVSFTFQQDSAPCHTVK